MFWVMAVLLASAWVGHASALSRAMGKRGFDRLSWLVVALFLGPALWPLALAEAAAGMPYPEVVRRAQTRPGLHVIVLLDRDHFPEELERQVGRLVSDCGRIVLARVVRAGGPASVRAAAVRFLGDAAASLDATITELRILYGTLDRAATAIYEEGEFAFVFRSDDPRELYDGGGRLQKVRSLPGSPAA